MSGNKIYYKRAENQWKHKYSGGNHLRGESMSDDQQSFTIMMNQLHAGGTYKGWSKSPILSLGFKLIYKSNSSTSLTSYKSKLNSFSTPEFGRETYIDVFSICKPPGLVNYFYTFKEPK